MTEPDTAAFAVSSSSEVPPGELSPASNGAQRLLFTHDLVSGKHHGLMRFGIVRMIHGEEEFDESDESDSDAGGDGKGGVGDGRGGVGGRPTVEDSDNDSPATPFPPTWPVSQGFVRVQWYPDGTRRDVRETKLKLEDRSIVPSDLVRRMDSDEKQCGSVTNINTECAVKLVGTNCVVYPVNSRDLKHVWSFMHGDYIVYDYWLGKVHELGIQIIVKLSNGSRCSMSEEDGAKLYDIYPHVSDVGQFFDDAYGFYPGQVLIGPSKVFANVQWLYGVKPVLSKKSKFRVVVEEVQVVELKVTWITKSYSTKGSDSVFPPSSTISQQDLGRVKRLGYFDHSQKLLGVRALYVFPAKIEATQITCEKAASEAPVLRKLKRMFKKDIESKVDNASENDVQPTDTSQPEADNDLVSADPMLSLVQQDSDEEDELDTDDSSSVTSSASSTVSVQSASARKKSIPLSIRSLKRKHKKKRTKFSREFKPGDRVAVEVVSTVTSADVLWKDGRLEIGIRSNDLIPIQHLDNHEFCPGDCVVDKRAQDHQDPSIYGVIQSGDHKARTCVVKWVKLNSASDNVEVIGEEEDVSVYDIAEHPDFHFHTTDTVIRIGNPDVENCENERSVGQVCSVDLNSKVEVVWADNSKTIVLPQHLYNIESEIETTYYESGEGSSSGCSSEWEDESDSWETDNGVVEDEASVDEATPVSFPNHGTADEVETPDSKPKPAGAEGKPSKETPARPFRELKEALKILESLKNMTVEQLWTGSPTSPTADSVNVPCATSTPTDAKPTKEKRFLNDIKKLQENLKKTLDNVAIVEEEKMDAAADEERTIAVASEAHTPIRSEWPSDTPVLCQKKSGGRPGVTFTSAMGDVFSVLESSPDTHSFKKLEFQPAEAKKFFSTVRKEMALLATSLPDGIMVKTFEDRMDLFSALIKGPNRTPYEDGLFLFDIQLPNIYPASPPLFLYLSQCSGRLNPNLYDNGKVCVSLLGTWIGKGTERWTSKSSLLQVLISIQGLILVNEPYYNEAGFDSDRGLQEGYENSRCYNEMALIKTVQSMTRLLQHPVDVFRQEIQEHFNHCGWRLLRRLESWLELNGATCGRSSRSEDHCATQDPSGLQREPQSPTTLSSSDCDASAGEACEKASGEPLTAVRPKKRRKSYRSFLPERSGYPDIGFPLFPLSKGFVKSMRVVLQQYRAALMKAAVPEVLENE